MEDQLSSWTWTFFNLQCLNLCSLTFFLFLTRQTQTSDIPTTRKEAHGQTLVCHEQPRMSITNLIHFLRGVRLLKKNKNKKTRFPLQEKRVIVTSQKKMSAIIKKEYQGPKESFLPLDRIATFLQTESGDQIIWTESAIRAAAAKVEFDCMLFIHETSRLCKKTDAKAVTPALLDVARADNPYLSSLTHGVAFRNGLATPARRIEKTHTQVTEKTKKKKPTKKVQGPPKRLPPSSSSSSSSSSSQK